jgi:hypothetical protein
MKGMALALLLVCAAEAGAQEAPADFFQGLRDGLMNLCRANTTKTLKLTPTTIDAVCLCSVTRIVHSLPAHATEQQIDEMMHTPKFSDLAYQAGIECARTFDIGPEN